MLKRRWDNYRWRYLLLIVGMLAALLPAPALATAGSAPAGLSAAAGDRSGGYWYTVRYGDTLSEIAARHGTTVQAIMQANGLTNPNFVYVGQRLYIPGGGYGGACVAYHVVRYGETLKGIALRYGVSMYDIARANNIYNLERIYVGQRLCIPGGGAPPPSQGGFWYTVRYGDTVGKIAYRYGTTIYAIAYANNLSNPNRIYVGQRLWIPAGAPPPPAPTPQPTPQPQPQPGPWTGLYYANRELSGSPAMVRQDAEIRFDWYTGSPSGAIPVDNFSVLWTRTAYFSAGTYRFYVTVDDGMRLYVDDRLLVDAWRIQPATGYFGDIYLSPGTHVIRVEYFEASGVASVSVGWARLY